MIRYRIVLRYIKHQLQLEASHNQSDFKMLKLMLKWAIGYEQGANAFEELLKPDHQSLYTCENNKDIRRFKEVFYEICSGYRHTW